MAQLSPGTEEGQVCTDYWTQAVDRFCSQLWHSATASEFLCPIEFKSGGPCGLERTQVFVREFGRTIAVWPVIWSHARDHGMEYLLTPRA